MMEKKDTKPVSGSVRSENMMMKRTKGFTLVELLVVVAIIALLVSILLPSLGKAKEQAKMVMCLSNLKGLGLGFGMYTHENNDWYPQSCGAGGYSGPDSPSWDFVTLSYYGNRRMLHCPSDPPNGVPGIFCSRETLWNDYRGDDHYTVGGGTPEKDRRYARSYAMNLNICGQGPSWWDPTWPRMVHKTSYVTSPADTILLSECWYWSYSIGGLITPNIYNDYAGSHTGAGTSNYSSGRYRGPTDDVHRNNDAANYLFCDMHVATLSVNDPKLIEPDDYYFKIGK